MKKLSGIIPAFPSPLRLDKTINEEASRKLIDHQITQGADGFYILGATGEGLVLPMEERMKLCEIVIDHVKGRKPVITHVAAIDLTTTIALAKHAQKAGSDCIAAIPPFYFKYDNHDIINYYKELDNAVQIPIMVYYHPAAQVNMSAELMAEIYQLEHVTAVKWSSNNYYEMMKLKDITNGEMNILNGPDETLVCGLAAGADGGIGTTYNIMLPEYKQIYHYFRQKEIDQARQIQHKINRVTEVLIRYKSIPAVKYALTLQGFDVGNATYPMTQYTYEQGKEIQNELLKAGWPFDEETTLKTVMMG